MNIELHFNSSFRTFLPKDPEPVHSCSSKLSADGRGAKKREYYKCGVRVFLDLVVNGIRVRTAFDEFGGVLGQKNDFADMSSRTTIRDAGTAYRVLREKDGITILYHAGMEWRPVLDEQICSLVLNLEREIFQPAYLLSL